MEARTPEVVVTGEGETPGVHRHERAGGHHLPQARRGQQALQAPDDHQDHGKRREHRRGRQHAEIKSVQHAGAIRLRQIIGKVDIAEDQGEDARADDLELNDEGDGQPVGRHDLDSENQQHGKSEVRDGPVVPRGRSAAARNEEDRQRAQAVYRTGEDLRIGSEEIIDVEQHAPGDDGQPLGAEAEIRGRAVQFPDQHGERRDDKGYQPKEDRAPADRAELEDEIEQEHAQYEIDGDDVQVVHQSEERKSEHVAPPEEQNDGPQQEREDEGAVEQAELEDRKPGKADVRKREYDDREEVGQRVLKQGIAQPPQGPEGRIRCQHVRDEHRHFQYAEPVKGPKEEPEVRIVLAAQFEERVARIERGINIFLQEGDVDDLVERAEVIAHKGNRDDGGRQEEQMPLKT